MIKLIKQDEEKLYNPRKKYSSTNVLKSLKFSGVDILSLCAQLLNECHYQYYIR